MLFKGSELISMPEASVKEKVIFALKALLAQVLAAILFVAMKRPAENARF